jgi:hypothetical protein
MLKELGGFAWFKWLRRWGTPGSARGAAPGPPIWECRKQLPHPTLLFTELSSTHSPRTHAAAVIVYFLGGFTGLEEGEAGWSASKRRGRCPRPPEQNNKLQKPPCTMRYVPTLPRQSMCQWCYRKCIRDALIHFVQVVGWRALLETHMHSHCRATQPIDSYTMHWVGGLRVDPPPPPPPPPSPEDPPPAPPPPPRAAALAARIPCEPLTRGTSPGAVKLCRQGILPDTSLRLLPIHRVRENRCAIWYTQSHQGSALN